MKQPDAPEKINPPGGRNSQCDPEGLSVSKDAVRKELQKIISSPEFRTSPHLKDFLKFAVEETLNGRAERLKEYAIGVEVFKRAESFDPRIDTIVRTEARRLRLRLAEYYAADGQSDSVRIDLIKGTYIPSFRSTVLMETKRADRPETDAAHREGIDPRMPPDPIWLPQPAGLTKSGPIRRLNWKAAALVLATLLMAGSLAIWFRQLSAPDQGEMPSILVVPFQNRSDDKSDEFFGDGLTDEIIDSLARVPGLRVVARSSAFQLKGKAIDARQVGRQFNVRSVLGGSVRRYGNRLRITAQLDDSANGYNLWSQTFDRDSQDILAIQREISQAIANALGIKLTNRGPLQSQNMAIVNPEAYQEYLKGRYFWNKSGIENNQAALDHFNLAIARDPNYAPAYAGLAHAYAWVLDSWKESTSSEVIPKIRAAATKALELDGTLGEPYLDLALIAELAYDWSASERELQRALEFAPASAYAHHRYSRYLRRVGRMAEALDQEREAAQLDPVSPLMAATVGIVLEHMGRFDEAIAEFRNALTLDSSSSLARKELGTTYIHKGLYEQGLAELSKLGKSDPYAACSLAYGYAMSGDEATARRMLGELLKEPEPRASFVAQIYAGLRNKDKTFEWLGKVINSYDPRLFLKTDPVYNFLHADPRFNDLLQQMNLN